MKWHLRRAVVMLWFFIAPIAVFSQDRFFDSNGVRIRYVQRGSGDVVVLIHGNGGSLDGFVASGVLENLARDYRVVALDVRGHGKSGKPHDTKAYGREMGLDVIRLLDHLGVQQAHIVGYSMGGSITGQLLISHAERFLTATLGGAPGRFRWTEEDTARAEKEASEKEHECISRSQIFRLSPANQPRPSEEEIKKQSEACMANPNQDRFALAALNRTFKDMVITPEQVAAVKVPTLGVVGSLDPYLEGFKEMKRIRPDLKLVVIEGESHVGVPRRPEFLAAVREFISSNGDKAVR